MPPAAHNWSPILEAQVYLLPITSAAVRLVLAPFFVRIRSLLLANGHAPGPASFFLFVRLSLPFATRRSRPPLYPRALAHLPTVRRGTS